MRTVLHLLMLALASCKSNLINLEVVLPEIQANWNQCGQTGYPAGFFFILMTMEAKPQSNSFLFFSAPLDGAATQLMLTAHNAIRVGFLLWIDNWVVYQRLVNECRSQELLWKCTKRREISFEMTFVRPVWFCMQAYTAAEPRTVWVPRGGAGRSSVTTWIWLHPGPGPGQGGSRNNAPQTHRGR